MTDTSSYVPNVSLGAKSGDGLTPLNRPGAVQQRAGADGQGAVYPFDPRAEGTTVEVVNTYLRSLAGDPVVVDSERARVYDLEASADEPRVSIHGLRDYLDGTGDWAAEDVDEEPAAAAEADESGE